MIIATALKDLKRRLRDPAAFAIWIGFPLALGSMISLAFGGLASDEVPTAEIWVADEDQSVLSGILVTALAAGADLGFPVVAREVSLSEGRSMIDRGNGTALLVIPENFADDYLNERPTRLELVTNPVQSVLPQMVEESLKIVVDAAFYLQAVFGEPISQIVESANIEDGFLDSADVAAVSILINDTMRRVGTFLNPPVIEVEVIRPDQGADAGDDGLRFVDVFLPSMLFMALVFMALGISEDMWTEKQQGTLRRALATPNAAAKLLAGKLAAAAAIMAVVVFVSLLGARHLLDAGVDNLVLAGAWATLSGVLILVLVYPLQLFATSQRGGGVLSGLVMMPLLMLGGSFFPFDVMPQALARIGRLTPNGFALTELVSIMQDHIDWTRLALSIAVMAAVGVVLFFVCCRRMAGTFARS